MPVNSTTFIGEHKGYKMYLFAALSYQCPALSLYGYGSERQLKNGINRELKKRQKKGIK